MMEEIQAVSNDHQLTGGVLRAGKPVAVVFYADWCGDCRRFGPTFSELAGQYGKRIGFAKIDTHAAPQLEAAWHIGPIPTVILFDNGVEVKRWEFDMEASSYHDVFDAIGVAGSE